MAQYERQVTMVGWMQISALSSHVIILVCLP